MGDRPSTILLVEDNRMDIELTLDAFRETRPDNEIVVVNDGQKALDYLFGNNEYTDRERCPLPSLVLLDLKMLGINGFEVLRRLKQAPVLKRIPIVVLTTSDEESDRATSYDCGANSYLEKPVSYEGFLNMVGKIDQYWLRLNMEPPIHESLSGKT